MPESATRRRVRTFAAHARYDRHSHKTCTTLVLSRLSSLVSLSFSLAVTDEAVREELYEKIISTPGVVWSARVVSAARIDEINILMASLEAMRLSIVDVLGRHTKGERNALALIDGPFSPWKEGEKYVDFQTPQPPPPIDLRVEPLKGGDGKVYCIAAASIIAKVGG